ncbi:hypothetical protein POM88_008563 [Heracleum sosnowskyi]|uniref:Uncharacterized protein n=1 Tax=Heracleum sosnowskyi TaxID=360622 RepID=A0AAD8N1U4_9APIA|nr:hypothetical protein POM88_008563 [Heracleum sosnowskyi]
MERKSCCSGRSCCPSTRTMTTPKKEQLVAMKTPKVEVVKPEPVKKAGDYQVSPVKVEKKEATAYGTSVKKEEAVKVNVGCGGGHTKAYQDIPKLVRFAQQQRDNGNGDEGNHVNGQASENAGGAAGGDGGVLVSADARRA